MRLAPAASCAEAFCGHFAAPRDFTSSVEQYANFLSHLFIQLAGRQRDKRFRTMLSRIGEYLFSTLPCPQHAPLDAWPAGAGIPAAG